MLVFALIRQLFKRFDYAIITAGLFALNTVQVESVAWLAGSMKIGAYSLFFLATLLAYVRYLEDKHRGWFAVSLSALPAEGPSLEVAMRAMTSIFRPAITRW